MGQMLHSSHISRDDGLNLVALNILTLIEIYKNV